ncbi:hypothetical protein ACQPYK_16105 [Streptosporangium sp. CA-135522]|uniref:hypothetical protein n=1 Tax=Streptosporangium sp. CA-135522 TaxID=3240072 RepID=UPI003D917EDC
MTDPSDHLVTPAQLRDLADRAEALSTELRATQALFLLDGRAALIPLAHQIDGDPDQIRRTAATLRAVASGLAMVNARPADACQALEGGCPDHGCTLVDDHEADLCHCGEKLRFGMCFIHGAAWPTTRTWCVAPGCDRTWDYPRRLLPCPETARWIVGPGELRRRLCDGHALARRTILGETSITQLTSTNQPTEPAGQRRT